MTVQAHVSAFGELLLFESEIEVNRTEKAKPSQRPAFPFTALGTLRHFVQLCFRE